MCEPLSRVEVLATVPDPRSPKGIRHSRTAILSLIGSNRPNGIGPSPQGGRGPEERMFSLDSLSDAKAHTSSRIAGCSTRCSGRPVGSRMVVVAGSMPRL